MQESNATNNQTVRALTTRIRVTKDRFINYQNLIEEKLNKDEECEELRKKNEELTKELSDLRAEIVKLFETISEQASGQVEKEDKEMEEELFENVSEQAQDNAEGAKQQDQLDQATSSGSDSTSKNSSESSVESLESGSKGTEPRPKRSALESLGSTCKKLRSDRKGSGPNLEEDGKEMEEELRETVPEETPGPVRIII